MTNRFLIPVLFWLIVFGLGGSTEVLRAGERKTEAKDSVYYQLENGRFYSCTPLQTGQSVIVAAVGQLVPQQTGKHGGGKSDGKGEGKGDGSGGGKGKGMGKRAKRQGYVALLELKNNQLIKIYKDSFQLTYQDRQWPTRVRTVASAGDSLYITGRGGSDEEGIGFLRHYIYNKQNNRLKHTATFIIEKHQESEGYTHGYSLKTGDIDGDGVQEAVYGGFYGKTIHEHLSEDFADVRIYKPAPGGTIDELNMKPFAKMDIPLRVNAMEVKDLNGDGKAEIIIAGRSRQGDREYSSFAIWWGNRITVHIDREQSLPGRFRTVMALDLDNDGKDELITGGRIDLGERMVADLQTWDISPKEVKMISRYNWTSDASTRLRTLTPCCDSGRFFAAGRTELLHSGDSARWIGFVRRFQWKNGSLWPTDLPLLLDKGPETRIRDIKRIGSQYLAAGFIVENENKSSGFVWIF